MWNEFSIDGKMLRKGNLMTYNPSRDSNTTGAPTEAIKAVIKGSRQVRDVPPPKILDRNTCPANDGPNVLFVDDEAIVARMGKRTLTQLGYAVTTMTNSEEALVAFAENPVQFDVVITDQTMPGLTGVSLAKEMLAIRPDTPIILVTGYNEHVNECSSRAAGIKRYVKKPIEISALARIIDQLLE